MASDIDALYQRLIATGQNRAADVVDPETTKAQSLTVGADGLLAAQSFTEMGGKVDGKPVMVNLIYVAGYKMEVNTGIDFLLMQLTALQQGHLIQLSPGKRAAFRTYDQQKSLYDDHYPKGVKLPHKSVVANPDVVMSNHQKGLAVDIDVGMANFQVPPTAVFLWLEQNAAKFGFSNDEGRKPDVNEPWHWVHVGGRVVGTNVVRDVTIDKIDGLQLLTRAADPKTSGLTAWSLRDTAAKLAAQTRARDAATSTRDKALAVALAGRLGRVTVTKTDYAHKQAQLSAQEIARFVFASSADANAFDYVTGTWGNGEPV